MRLKNKIAIITGGARGIGKAVSTLFAKEGAIVIIWDLLEEGDKTAKDINGKGGIAEFTKISVTDKSAIEAEATRIYNKYGKIDILINNAGITKDRTLHKMSEAEWDAVIDVNLKGVFLCTQIVSKYMKEAGYGRIVSAASNVGLRGNFGQTNYAASKAAIQGFTRSLCREVGKYGITVNCVAPGFIQSEMTDSMPEAVVAAGIKMIPAGRIGTPEDMGYAYLFLSSREAAFVNGITLHANGGAYPV